MNNVYDIVVIGGGASGLYSALHAVTPNNRVVIIERNLICGKKLSITGGGRCNIWNEEYDLNKLTSNYGDKRDHIKSIFDKYNVQYHKQFFKNLGIETKVENHGRAFPKSESAINVRDKLVEKARALNIDIITNTRVMSIDRVDECFNIATDNQQIIISKKVIIATGGLSHPETGSTGDGFKLLQTLGHNIIQPTKSLAPIITKDKWSHKLAGISLYGIKYDIRLDNKIIFKPTKIDILSSRILFTHDGLSGPTIINNSPIIIDSLPHGDITFNMYLFGNIDEGELRQKLLEIFDNNKNKNLANALLLLENGNIIKTYLEQTMNLDIKVNEITRELRFEIARKIIMISFNVIDVKVETHSIITDGGVNIGEVNMKTCESLIVPGIYIIGDLLNIRRPSGGFSLQLCWSTGAAAGESAGVL